MSLVSVLPFAGTLKHWWHETDGEPDRLQFMALKLVEVSAFLGNGLARSFRPSATQRASGDAPAAQPPNAVPEDPTVVVVVPVFCRTAGDVDRVEALLASLNAQTRRCQVVLVDDCSPVCAPSAGAHVINLDRNVGPAAARNKGIERALALGADVVALTDADCVPRADWIASVIAAFHGERRAHAISGATWSKDSSALGRYHERNGTLNGRLLRGQDRLLYGPTCNLSLAAPLAQEIRFDESYRLAASEDIDFCFRANRRGWSILHAPGVVVQHDYGYDGLSRFKKVQRMWNQFQRYSIGERHLLRMHPDYGQVFEGSREISLDARRD